MRLFNPLSEIIQAISHPSKIVSRVANTVNNDVVRPLDRLVNPKQQQSNFIPASMQKINLKEGGGFPAPQLQTQSANQIRLNAQKSLQLAPTFVSNLVNAAPSVSNIPPTSVLTNSNGAQAEYLGQSVPNQIVLSNKNSNSLGINDPPTILHEGLHRVYATNPQVRKQFVDAYNKSVKSDPGIKYYLASRLYPYAGFAKGLDEGGVPISNYDLNNIKNLPPNLQDEAHSFLSELPAAGNELPSALKKYYDNYFNTSAVQKRAYSKLLQADKTRVHQ